MSPEAPAWLFGAVCLMIKQLLETSSHPSWRQAVPDNFCFTLPQLSKTDGFKFTTTSCHDWAVVLSRATHSLFSIDTHNYFCHFLYHQQRWYCVVYTVMSFRRVHLKMRAIILKYKCNSTLSIRVSVSFSLCPWVWLLGTTSINTFAS